MIIGFIFAIIGAVFVGWCCYKSGKRSGYWEGRGSGWKSCEDMVIRRMLEKGYDKDKIWEDLIQ
jgi:hypothetical protein